MTAEGAGASGGKWYLHETPMDVGFQVLSVVQLCQRLRQRPRDVGDARRARARARVQTAQRQSVTRSQHGLGQRWCNRLLGLGKRQQHSGMHKWAVEQRKWGPLVVLRTAADPALALAAVRVFDHCVAKSTVTAGPSSSRHVPPTRSSTSVAVSSDSSTMTQNVSFRFHADDTDAFTAGTCRWTNFSTAALNSAVLLDTWPPGVSRLLNCSASLCTGRRGHAGG